uniref:Transmembrane protein 201 [Octodon degus] n=1 Tax=Lepeophtheirus salmonis TaxID=72036 RepID=A0A0K2TLM9_LEPSM
MEGEEDSANMNLYLSGGSILLTGAVAALTLLLNRKLSNPSFLLLNCWFCNENFSIPLRKAKSWTCPSCDGYNGFSNDGDYNTDLKTSSLRPQRYARPQIKAPIHSDLCRDCELNQCLKVSQLSAFVPKDERNFDMEIEDYEAHLERVYRLCRQCEAALHQKLGEQDAKIRPNLLSWRLESNRLAAKRDGGISAFVHATPRASKAKRFFVFILALGLALSYEAALTTGLLTVLLLLAYNTGGLLMLRRHRIVVLFWVITFSSGVIKEYYKHLLMEIKYLRLAIGIFCCLFTMFVWNISPPSKKKNSSFKKTISTSSKNTENDTWGLISSTSPPSVKSSRVSSIFNAKEDECHEENSKYDISSLSIEDNVETEFTLMGSASDKGNHDSNKGSPPFIIKKYNGLADNEIYFKKRNGLTVKRRNLIRPATLSPPPESPSKAIAKASWVAGGYWHPKDKLGLSSPERTLSRSSSQSSGFVSYDNYPSSPNLRVIRNTFARSSVPPEHKPYEKFPVRQVASSSDRYSCDDPSFHGNTGFVDSSSSIASSSRQCLNDSPNKIVIMEGSEVIAPLRYFYIHIVQINIYNIK